MKLSKQRSTTEPGLFDHSQRCMDVQAHKVQGQECILDHNTYKTRIRKNTTECVHNCKGQMKVAKPTCSKVKTKCIAKPVRSHTSSCRKQCCELCKKSQDRCPISACPQCQMKSAFQVRKAMLCNACVRVSGTSLSTLMQS